MESEEDTQEVSFVTYCKGIFLESPPELTYSLVTWTPFEHSHSTRRSSVSRVLGTTAPSRYGVLTLPVLRLPRA